MILKLLEEVNLDTKLSIVNYFVSIQYYGHVIVISLMPGMKFQEFLVFYSKFYESNLVKSTVPVLATVLIILHKIKAEY